MCGRGVGGSVDVVISRRVGAPVVVAVVVVAVVGNGVGTYRLLGDDPSGGVTRKLLACLDQGGGSARYWHAVGTLLAKEIERVGIVIYCFVCWAVVERGRGQPERGLRRYTYMSWAA